MTKEQFTEMLEELMAKIESGPSSHVDVLAQIAKRYEALQELQEVIVRINESMGAIRLILKYMIFDLEATRRERDQLRMKLEDKG